MSSSSPEWQGDWLSEYPPVRSLILDQEALRIYEHAYAIGERVEEVHAPRISFTIVLAALLAGTDETSRWFQQTAGMFGPARDLVLQEKPGLQATVVGDLAVPDGPPEKIQLSSDKHLLTASAREVLLNAESWAQRVGGSDIGVRHLVAAYVLNPPANHRQQMRDWNYRERPWRAPFFTWVADRYTAEQWIDASQRIAPTKTALAFEEPEVKGAELAYPADEGLARVLENAAELHARRSDRWLGFATVFHALVKTAKDHADVRARIEPIMTAVDESSGAYGARAHEMFPGTAAREVVPFDELDISPRVLNGLETARGLAVTTTPDEQTAEPVVGADHLAGALLSRRVDGAEAITELGLDPMTLRRAMIEHAVSSPHDREVWREALGEEDRLVAGRPVELNSDEPESVIRQDEDWESDPLGIRRDVETFAALLASQKLEPPLSIGLFGPWGSGKTTFLRRLRRAVDTRTEQARAEPLPEGSPYVRQVVHVEFNAWHFAESALVSSLMDTVFRSLRDHIGSNGTPEDDSCWAARVAELQTRRQVEAAEAAERAARTEVEAALSKLQEVRGETAAAATGLHAALNAAWRTARETLQANDAVKSSGVLDALGESVDGIEALQRRTEAIRARPVRILGSLGWKRTVLFALLVLGLPPLAAWLLRVFLGAGDVGEILTMAATSISTLAVWLRAGAGAVAEADKALVAVTEAYEQRVEEAPGVVVAREELAAARERAATASRRLDAAREALGQAQLEVSNARVPAQMLELVSRRIDADSYGDELTTLALARADLDALSRLLLKQEPGSADATVAEGDAKRAVERVILYIDDLDRCEPADVVRVLQIVHMLLAFELFVVVVAVDAHWVETSLRDTFQWLAERESAASKLEGGDTVLTLITAEDYLEKIFQISFWLEPMSAARAASYLGSLVRTPRRKAASPPSGVDISGVELDYMRALAAYVGSSPRRVKRLVNAYRLIKAGLSDAQLGRFVTERAGSSSSGPPRSGPYQLVIGLLVIGTGARASSGDILRELAQCDPKTSADEIVDEFRQRDHPDWTMAARVLETLIRSQKMKNVAELRGWARKVGRFLLDRPAAHLWASARSSPGGGAEGEADVDSALEAGGAAAGERDVASEST